MHNLARPKEFYGFAYIRVVYKPQDVVVRASRLLLCRHVLVKVGDGIALHLEFAGVKGNSSRSLGPYANGVVNIILVKAALFDLLHGEIAGQLENNGSNHFQMCQFFRADVGIEIAHLKNTVKWTHHHYIEIFSDRQVFMCVTMAMLRNF